MRVLHLFDWYLPSTLSWVSRLLQHLPESEVWVGAPWIVRNQFYHESFRYLEFPPQRWCFSLESEWQYPALRHLFTRSQRFLPSYRLWLAGRIASNLPDVVHTHFGPTGCLYSALAQKLNIPLVVTFYGFDYRKIWHYRPVFRKKYRELFAKAAAVVAASPTGCEALEAMGCPAAKLRVVRPCPDIALFPFIAKAKPPGRLRLVQAATFTEKKGHLTTLEAFRLALPDCPGLHLTLAGEQYDRQLVRSVEAFIRSHGLQEQVVWTGPVPHDQMARFLGDYHAFIHPSRTPADGDHEATPVVLLEAQAIGLPVLATRHFDLPDAVAHGSSGWLVPEGDASAMSEAIRMFYLMEGNQYQSYRLQARKWVEDHFSIQSSAVALRKIYGELT